MSKNVPMMGFQESSAGKAGRGQVRGKSKSPAVQVPSSEEKPKASLTPEQEHYVDESFKRFDTLYRKLAE